jgi:hypothetical protein
MIETKRSFAMRRLAIVAAAVFITTTAFPGASFALDQVRTWNSESKPLVEKSYGSTGKAYGKWKVTQTSDGTKSRAYGYSRLSVQGRNHEVYLDLDTHLNSGYCAQASKYMSCTKQYFYHESDEGTHHARNSWYYNTAQTGVKGSADYARAGMATCLDIPIRPDTCSGRTYTEGDKY